MHAEQVVDEVLDAFRGQLAGFDVTIDVPPGLPAIRGDRTAMRLLFDNLVDNAIRYSGDVRSLSIDASARDRRVTIAVRDRGTGIPADEIDKVTRKFFRGRAAGSGGSGLGLAIVRRIVDDHGGGLEIRSQPGEGTTVMVSLPAAEP